MKTRSKALLLALCAVLLVCSTIFGTLAYLTDTDDVVNTFTIGKVGISLDEAKVKTDGTVDGTDRVKANEYHLLPGHTYTKDPTVHVDKDSEDCWLFVKVVDELAAIQDVKTVATQMGENGWTLVTGETNIYAYKDIVVKDATNKDVKVFENFKIKGEVKNEELAAYEGKTITVIAYAIQADGFATAEAAWTAANGQFTNTQG